MFEEADVKGQEQESGGQASTPRCPAIITTHTCTGIKCEDRDSILLEARDCSGGQRLRSQGLILLWLPFCLRQADIKHLVTHHLLSPRLHYKRGLSLSYFTVSVIVPLSQMRWISQGPTFWQVLNRDPNLGGLLVTHKLLFIACNSLAIKMVLGPKRPSEADPVRTRSRSGSRWRSESGKAGCPWCNPSGTKFPIPEVWGLEAGAAEHKHPQTLGSPCGGFPGPMALCKHIFQGFSPWMSGL